MVETTPTSETGRLRFEMRQLLGAGSFGEVYLATMASTGGIRQEVAVKVLNVGLDPRSQPVERLRDEGRILGGLNHPVILQVRDLVVLQGRIGLVMEYVPGADLSYVLDRQRTLEPRLAMHIVGHVGDALDTAFHAKASDGAELHLVHRDVKPANIRLTPHGTVKLLDFGIAKAQEPERETSTSHVVLMGSLPYMAPEVVHMDVEEADVARDVFALGCVLFECLTGELFFEDLKRKDLRRHTAREERFAAWKAERMAKVPGDLHVGVRDLLDAMLAYDASTRPSPRAVADLAHELAEDVGGSTLRRWARAFPWPAQRGESGAWTGQRISETTMVPGSVLSAEMDDDYAARSGSEATLPIEMNPALGLPNIGAPSDVEHVVPPLDSLPPDLPTVAPSAAPPANAPVDEALDAYEAVANRRRAAFWVWIVGGALAAIVLAWMVWPFGAAPVEQAPDVLAAAERATEATPAVPAEEVVPSVEPLEQDDPAATDAVDPSPQGDVEAEQPAAVPAQTPAAAPDAPGSSTATPSTSGSSRTPAASAPDKPKAASTSGTPDKPKPAPAASAQGTPDPAPKPATEAPAAAPALGTVRLDRKGDFPVELRSGSRRQSLGKVAPGTWSVWADFGDGFSRQLDISVADGSTVVLRCRQILAFCEVK